MSTTTKNYQILQKLEGEGNYLKLHPETNAEQVITSGGSNVQSELGARYTKTETDALLNTKVNNDDLGNWNFGNRDLKFNNDTILSLLGDGTHLNTYSYDLYLEGASQRPFYYDGNSEEEIALLEDVNKKANSTDVYTKQESDAKYPSLANGIIPQSYLPSYVDDVLEYEDRPHFPSVGEAGKIYVDKFANLTYRWSGSTYVEISPSLALGETASTAYAGDKGAELKRMVDTHDQSIDNLDQGMNNFVSGYIAVGKAKALDHDVDFCIDSDTLVGSNDQLSNLSGTEVHLNVELKNSGITAGTYSCVSVDQYGRATAGAQIVEVGTTGQTAPSSTLAIGGIFFKEI